MWPKNVLKYSIQNAMYLLCTYAYSMNQDFFKYLFPNLKQNNKIPKNGSHTSIGTFFICISVNEKLYSFLK